MGWKRYIAAFVAIVATLVGGVLPNVVLPWAARALEAWGYPFLVGLVPWTVDGQDGLFLLEDVPAQTDKLAIVTGGKAGAGFHTALQLARSGAIVVLPSRNLTYGKMVATTINSSIENLKGAGYAEAMKADMASLSSVKSFVMDFKARFKGRALDILVWNSGAWSTKHLRSVDGIEHMWAKNVLGHHYLTRLLEDMLNRCQGGPRLVVVSSYLSYFVPNKVLQVRTEEDLNDPSQFSVGEYYSMSKLARVIEAKMFALENPGWIVNAAQTGLTGKDKNTRSYQSLLDRTLGPLGRAVLSPIVDFVQGAFLWTSEDASRTILYLATAVEDSGGFYHPIGRLVQPDDRIEDSVIRDRIWNMNERSLRKRGYGILG